MLELKKITKDYAVGDGKVQALKGVDISFRKSEFVSVLGPSGCGKTTLLNIIGGLDHYTSGEMYIDDVSTKNYGDRDWDTYRNHRIGFVFQSYNLIPHQTISQNVELALNISGVDKAERVRRAHEALDKVGLKGQYNKKPNQLSGGQCQRVAIARALVNEPEILLADEPTGALDTVTSVQIMDLIQDISKERLVIMVTHNPELAEKYSTRIIKLLDGEVVADSNPFGGETEEEKEPANEKETKEKEAQAAIAGEQKPKTKKAKLSFWSAFKLSARNLLSKLKRTLLVCFAGSIGIIGVATVLAVSTGVQNFIADMQNDMLSGNPVRISTEALDMTAIMESMNAMEKAGAASSSIENGKINVEQMIEYLAERGGEMESAMIRNDITNEYLEYVKAMPEEYYASVSATYGINSSLNLYTDFKLEALPSSADGETSNPTETKTMSLAAAIEMYTHMLGKTEFKDYAQYIPMFTDHFRQLPGDKDFILSQYDIISDKSTSKFAEEEDEIMLVVSDKYSLTDLTLAQFGYFSQDEFLNIAYKAIKDDPDAQDKYDENLWKDKFTYSELLGKTFTWYPNDTIYQSTENMPPIPGSSINKENVPFTYRSTVDNSFTGGKKLKITAILRPKEGMAYGSMQSGFYYTSKFTDAAIADGLNSEIVKYLNDNELESFSSAPSTAGGNDFKVVLYPFQYVLNGEPQAGYGVAGTMNQLSLLLGAMGGGSANGGQEYKIYTLSKRDLGGVNTPSAISVYPTDFEWKNKVCAYLDKWNESGDITVGDKVITAEQREEIKYTDNLGLVISLVNDLIDIVTAALIAFTALSLVVSTVMIAIITYVSVMERVKEIGVIRSLGGRKRDVSALFVAETFIIGGSSGVFGIAITYLLSFIINMILGTLFGIYSIAALPVLSAVVMIGISILLTMIAGIIPASLAAKKDPVDALRSE